MNRRLLALTLCAIALGAFQVAGRAQAGRAQFSAAFTKEEFAGRRARIAGAIGKGAIALVQGANERAAA